MRRLSEALVAPPCATTTRIESGVAPTCDNQQRRQHRDDARTHQARQLFESFFARHLQHFFDLLLLPLAFEKRAITAEDRSKPRRNGNNG
jgi:hypothetical protein